MQKLIKIQEHFSFIMPRLDAYRFALLIDMCYRNPMFGKYTLHNLNGQSINWTNGLICLKFSGKIDNNTVDL